jgi:hypothetical protein
MYSEAKGGGGKRKFITSCFQKVVIHFNYKEAVAVISLLH